MNIEKISDNWLFENHSKQTIKEWLKRLKYFYFIRACGGQTNDFDAFRLDILYSDKQDLIEKLGQLGITLNTIQDNFPRPVDGKQYTLTEFENFKDEISRFRNLEQPKKKRIFGYHSFVWITDSTIQISISGTNDKNPSGVAEANFQVCVDLERQFNRLKWQNFKDKRIEENICCISKTRYPELYD